MAESATVILRLLGRFEFVAKDGSSAGLPASGRRGRALLAYLAMRPDFSETRERLATLLWGDRLDRQARQSLRQCLLSLRKDCEAIGVELVRADQVVVRLHGAALSVDARALPVLAQSICAHDIDAAIGLYRGEFLDGLHIDSEAFTSWVAAERERLHGCAALALGKRVEASDQAGDGPRAIAAAEQLAALDPQDEGAQRVLLGILARHGGREVALARAAALTRRVRQEFDAEPEPATQAMIAAIRQGDIPVLPRGVIAPRTGAMATASAALPDAAARQPPRQVRRSAIAIAGGAAVVAAVVLALGWRLHRSTAPDHAAATSLQSWQPPGLLATVGIDQAEIAAHGLSAVIVLPFTVEGSADDTASKRLAQVLTDGLIDDLSHLPQVRVIARQTSRLYGDHRVDVATIGAELGVRYVIDGSIQYQAPRLRIAVSLSDAASRLTVWSQHVDHDYDQRFEAQDEIIHAVTRALHLSVIDAEDRRRPPGPRDPAIDDLLARGWAAMTRLVDLGTNAGADGYFTQVLARDPGNVSALIGLGGYHAGVAALFLVPDEQEHLAKAERLLRQSIARAPASVMGYYYLGIVDKLRGQLPAALADFTKVVERDPSLPLAYAQVGHLIAHMGKLDEGMEDVRYAIRLNPKDPNMSLISLIAGELELERGRDAAALSWLERSVSLAPLDPFPHAALAAALMLNGRTEEAAQQVADLRRLTPWLTLDRMLARLTVTAEAEHEPRRLIEGLRKAFAAG